LIAYAALIVAAVTLPWRPVPALFDIGAVIVLFLTLAQANPAGERQE